MNLIKSVKTFFHQTSLRFYSAKLLLSLKNMSLLEQFERKNPGGQRAFRFMI